jgi:hypothetical protein
MKKYKVDYAMNYGGWIEQRDITLVAVNKQQANDLSEGRINDYESLRGFIQEISIKEIKQ